ncbi:hypothetical protein A6R73_05850 [Xanthomonas translucens pv. poae]|uniref:Uncharacterized protein n=1 Tax=Xanthomonas graminis pv. poae TaxID=227946 RepID=A0A199NYG3_9XANT|nr:hypothetical protein A6R73_05850 [Xanthomonas translucens pv. poae]
MVIDATCRTSFFCMRLIAAATRVGCILPRRASMPARQAGTKARRYGQRFWVSLRRLDMVRSTRVCKPISAGAATLQYKVRSAQAPPSR